MRLGLPFTLVFVSSFLALRVWTDGLEEGRSDQDCQIPTQSCVQEETFQDISGEEDLDVLASRMSSIGPLLSLLERSSRLENFHVIVIRTRNGTHFLHVLNLVRRKKSDLKLGHFNDRLYLRLMNGSETTRVGSPSLCFT